MNSSEIRAKARENLAGKWGKAALFTLIYGALMYLITFVCSLIPIIGPIANAVISVPLGFGLISCFMKLKRNEEFGYLDFFKIAFSSFGKIWSVTLQTALKMIVPIILVIVFYTLFIISSAGTVLNSASYYNNASSTGFEFLTIISIIGVFASSIYAAIKGLYYSLTYYILYDNPDMPSKEIVEKSASLMNGNRARLFYLQLSFIGWAILASLTFGIGFFWLLPYMAIAMIVFYEMLSDNSYNVTYNVTYNENSNGTPSETPNVIPNETSNEFPTDDPIQNTDSNETPNIPDDSQDNPIQ